MLSKRIGLIWLKRILLAAPLAAATALTVLMSSADYFHLHAERIAGYGFLFGTPWAWLLDHDWFGNIHSRLAQSLISYAVVLWIPALLYFACLWFLLRVLGIRAGRIRG